MEVPAHFSPREYQARFLSEIRNYWFVVMEWARRGGKGLTTFVYAIQLMVEEPIGVVIIYPTAEQGYRSFWNNLENDGFRTIEHIPDALIASKTSTKDSMSMVLKNGSTLDLLGANADPDKFRGNNIRLYILSEFVDIDSGVLDIIEPIVIANGGQIIVESTPKQDGISGATFVKLRKAAEKDVDMYSSRVEATAYMTAEQLDRARRSCIAKWGNDFMYRQEYLLDEGQALETSYYGNIIGFKKKNGDIGDHPYDPEFPVYTSWDLGGGGDSTAGVFWQYHGKKLNIIDAYETHIVNDELLVKFCNSLKYAGNYGWHFFPHDGAKRDSDGIQRIEKMRKLGLKNASLLTRRRKEASLVDAIQLMNSSSTTAHLPATEVKIFEKLVLYKRKWNSHTGDYEGPEHNTVSHVSDAIQYMSDAIGQYFHPQTGKFLINTEPVNNVPAWLPDDQVNWEF
jgi:phage terminase large subunit